MKKKVRRMISAVLAVVMLCGIIPANATVSKAATTANVSLSSLGRKGTVSFGSKSKSGTWWKMRLGSKEAFCLSLGHTCHSGNTYAAENSYKWDQDTGGEKHGYYAKIIRWYVLNGKRTQKSFVMSQALIWSVSEGRNSEAQLKDVIKQVKDNTHTYSSKTVNELYNTIFEPSGNWEATATIWQKTGNSKGYQKLITVDAEKTPQAFAPATLTDVSYYRQRITVKKKDEDGNGLGGIQFTLDADNLDDLYSFSVSDRDGVESSSAEEYSLHALEKMWREVRKRGGICTGMSQNLIDAQRNRSTKTMVSNSEFMLLLDQGTMDKEAVEDLFDISAEQLACVNGADPGMGLIRFGDKIVPFDNTMKKDSELYQLFNTNFHEIAGATR